MNKYRLTEVARQHLEDIFLDGVVLFGIRQAQNYSDKLKRRFELLAQQPHMGRVADDIESGLRRHEFESHVIFYKVKADHVAIMAIVHASRQPRLT